MSALKIEILNPKAIKLLQSMQELNLIKFNEEPESALHVYLKKMRKHKAGSPTIDEITSVVEEVRAQRYAKNKKA